MSAVCSTCDDTHRMTLGERGLVPCTRCPTPCERCRRPLGAYCDVTPCPCVCHVGDRTRADGERIRARHQIEQLHALLDSVAIVVGATEPPGYDAAQALTQAATSLAMTVARLDAYLRAEQKP